MRGSGTSQPVVAFAVTQAGSRADGGVASISAIVERLSRVTPVMLTSAETPVNDRWREAGADVHVLPWFGVNPRPTNPFGRVVASVGSIARSGLRAASVLKAVGADIVHCNDIRALWTVGPAARLAGARIVMNIRDVKPEAEPFGWHWRLVEAADRVIVLSREMKEALEPRLPALLPGLTRSTPIDFVYSIVDTVRMRPVRDACERLAVRARLGIAEDEFAIGYVAAVNEKKAQLEFIENLGPLLSTRLPDARVHFVGDFRPDESSYAAACSTAVDRLQLRHMMRFDGFAESIEEWYRGVDVVVLASKREGLARCMIESLASGTPVVSFAVPSAREVLEGNDCGVTVPQGDYAGLVAAVEELAAPATRERLGRNGRKAAERLFGAQAAVAAYEALYLGADDPIP